MDPKLRPAATEGTSLRLRLDEGEEAVVACGRGCLHSRGPLPLRARSEARHHGRPAFPGTCVLVGGSAYEVVTEDGAGERWTYGLRPWPQGEVERGRVAFDAGFLAAIQESRRAERLRQRIRPWRGPLYPLVGLLPEETQEWVCERLGLDALTATVVSGLGESLLVIGGLARFLGSRDDGAAIAGLLLVPGLALLTLPGLGRAFGALLLRETAGSALLAPLFALARRARTPARRRRLDGLERFTRSVFWRRLSLPDEVEAETDGFVVRGALPHLSWDPGHQLEAGGRHWRIEIRGPAREADRLVYTYLLRDSSGSATVAPPATAYTDEVWGEVRREWDAWNTAFAWITTLLSGQVQERAFGHRGGPAAARRGTIASSALTAVVGSYLLISAADSPAADPLAPFFAGVGVLSLADALWRLSAARATRYAPSLLRFLLPDHLLRPERMAFRAHQRAEREAEATLHRGTAAA